MVQWLWVRRALTAIVFLHRKVIATVPSRRTFDLVVLTVLLMHPVLGLAKMWATRVAADDSAGTVSKVAAGATRIVT